MNNNTQEPNESVPSEIPAAREDAAAAETSGSFAAEPIAPGDEPLDGTETEHTAVIKLAGDRVCTLRFDLSEITPRVRRQIAKLSEAGEDQGEDAMIDLLAGIVISWDYKSRKGVSCPPVADQIGATVSVRDLNDLASGIFAAINGNSKNVSAAPKV